MLRGCSKLYSEQPSGFSAFLCGRRSRLIKIDWCSAHYAVHGYNVSGFLVNLLLRHRLRGGVERNPGFMRSESRDAARAAKNRVIVYLQHSSSEEYFIN